MKYIYDFKKQIIASHIFRLLMIILLLISIFKQDWLWLIGCILGLIISFIPSVLKKNFNITLPWLLDFLIFSALFFHIGGGVLDAYHSIPYYDDFTHFVSSVLVAFFAFVVIYILDEYWDGLHMDKYAMAFMVVIFTMAMGVLWEFNEWISDTIFETNEQWGLNDTMSDLLVDTFGGIIVAFIGVNLIKKGSIKKITDNFGQEIDKLILSKFENKE
jgi:hypothetical protein